MNSKITTKVADKIAPYLTERGEWNLGKSEERRRVIKALLLPKPLPITRYELSCLQYAARKQAMDKLLAAIFSPITIIYGRSEKVPIFRQNSYNLQRGRFQGE